MAPRAQVADGLKLEPAPGLDPRVPSPDPGGSLLVACAIYTLIMVVMSAPLAWSLADHSLSGGSDTELFLWTIAWDVHALTHAPWAIFDANIFYPFKNTLAYSENLIGSAFFAAPVVWVTGNVVLAANLVAFVSSVLCAVGAHVLARQLGLSRPAAFVAGIVFAFAPSRLLRIDQMHLATIQWVPFTLAYLDAYFERGRPRDLRIAAALFALQALTSGHGAAFLLLGVVMLMVYRWIRGAPLAPARRLRDLGWIGVLALVPAVLIYLPYQAAQREIGLKRVLDRDWSLSASSFVSSPSHAQQWLLAQLPDWAWLRTPPDASLFPGVLPFLLAAAAFWPGAASARPADRWWRRAALGLDLLVLSQIAIGIAVLMRGEVSIGLGQIVLLRAHGWQPWAYAAIFAILRAVLTRLVPFAPLASIRARLDALRQWRGRTSRDDRWLYLAIVLMTIWLAVGPPLGVWQWLYWLPGLSFVRVPSRFTLLGVLAIGVLAAMGFDRMTSKLRARSRTAAAAIVGLVCLGEFAAMPIDVRPFAMEQPAIDRWLGSQPKPFSVLELPVPDSLSLITRERSNTRFMQHSTAHFQPIFQGYSGIQPPGYTETFEKLMGFPDQQSLETILDLGVTYIVVHPELWPPTDRPPARERFERFRDWFQLVHEEADGAVYVVKRPDIR
ncbi:MAG TPA: hypothetical protein VFO19_01265 [Vicinamibacterales bacterium]|nr:hypothetical protein [Vicinamibacterales bacterium]